MSATERISAYLARREKARGIDKESIHGFDFGTDCGIELRASDLRTLLDKVTVLRQELDTTLVDLKKALEVLRGIEFSRLEDEDDWYGYCPVCGKAEPRGHAPDCKLNTALTALGSGSEPTGEATR